MWKIDEWISLMSIVVVIYLGIKDIQTRRVSVWALWICAVTGILYIGYQIITSEVNYWLTFAGALVGVIFLIISKITEEAFGYGDSFIILFLGVIVGFWNILVILSMAFLLLLCVTIPLLWRKKMSRKLTLPFIPFLAGGYLCFFIMGGMNG